MIGVTLAQGKNGFLAILELVSPNVPFTHNPWLSKSLWAWPWDGNPHLPGWGHPLSSPLSPSADHKPGISTWGVDACMPRIQLFSNSVRTEVDPPTTDGIRERKRRAQRYQGWGQGWEKGPKAVFQNADMIKQQLGYIDALLQNPHGNETHDPQSLLGIQNAYLHSCWQKIDQLKKLYPWVIIFSWLDSEK